MDNLNLKPKQKVRLDRVAKLLLDIYNTLVRMQYLDAEWVIPGPHNVDHLIPMYRRYDLEDSIIYLYSRFPYIESADSELTFFGGSYFVDFRIEWDVAQGRKAIPFDEDDEILKPWMTMRSKVREREDIAIVYSAREDCIWMGNFMEEGSMDPYFNGNRDDGGQERQDSLADSEDEDDGDQDGENDHDSEDEDSDEESEADDRYSVIDSRRAADALRNIAKRFANFNEDPSIGDIPNDGWQLELAKSLYIKHGWPGDDFDGAAFQIDRVRAWAIHDAKETANQPIIKVQMLRYGLEKETPEYFERLETGVANADAVDEEWQARWWMKQNKALHAENVAQLKSAETMPRRSCDSGVAYSIVGGRETPRLLESR